MEFFTITFLLTLTSLLLVLYFFVLMATARKLEQHDIDISKVMEELQRNNFLH